MLQPCIYPYKFPVDPQPRDQLIYLNQLFKKIYIYRMIILMASLHLCIIFRTIWIVRRNFIKSRLLNSGNLDMVYLYDIIIIHFYTTIQDNKVREDRIIIESVLFVNLITVVEPRKFIIFLFRI